MNRKIKLVKLILLESEALKKAEGIRNILTLAGELNKDAVELAKLIAHEEIKEGKVA